MRAVDSPQLRPEFVERSPDDRLQLVEREVDLWVFTLASDEASVQRLRQVLDSTEAKRADRYRFPQHRRRFVVGRAMLRLLLGGYLRLDARKVRFHHGRRGKPHLAPPLDAGGVCFNLSNSADLAVVAVARGGRLGVDVEILRPLSSAGALATRFFSPLEQAELATVEPDSATRAFFNGWTRKEAFLKALGDGLAMPLSSFTVTLSLDAPAELRRVERADLAAEAWSLRVFAPAENTVGALAIEGSDWRLRCSAADPARWSRTLAG